MASTSTPLVPVELSPVWVREEQEKYRALVLACIPIPPAFIVAPFLREGVTSVLGWVEVALVMLLWMVASPKFKIMRMFNQTQVNGSFGTLSMVLSIAVLLALLGAYIAGIIFAQREYKDLTLRGPTDESPDEAPEASIV